jgi:hypothetical protein
MTFASLPAKRRFDRFALVSAALACLFALGYAIPQVLVVTVWSPPEWLEVAVIMAPSLGIALFFVPTMAAVHVRAAEDRKHLTLAAFGFALMYAALAGFVYMTQLSLVVPELYAGRPVDADLYRVADKTLMTMADAIAYGFMSVSAGLAAWSFTGDRLDRWTKGALLAHGLIAPGVVLAASIPAALLVGMLWLVTGPLSLGLVAAVFARDLRREPAGPALARTSPGGKPSA